MQQLKTERPKRKKSPMEVSPAEEVIDTPVDEATDDDFYGYTDQSYEDDHDPSDNSMGNIIDLPSKGMLGYPGEVTYREIMAGDEEILKTSTAKNFHRTVNKVLKSISNAPEHFDEISLHDRDYIISYIWANTYGSKKTFDVTCSKCSAKEEVTVDMTQIQVDDIKESYKKDFKLVIKKKNKEIFLRYSCIRDENNCEKFFIDHPDSGDTKDFVMMCFAINFKQPMDISERVRWMKENASAKEMQTIKAFHSHYRFGMDTQYDHVCSKCEGVTNTYIPFHPQDVIAPELQTDFEELLHAQ
jgi:hypothetical protein